jgi:hypothetical protein
MLKCAYKQTWSHVSISIFTISLTVLFAGLISEQDTRDIQKVTSGVLLTDEAMRKKCFIYKKYVHT